MKGAVKIPKCSACKYAVKIPGKRNLVCSHGSSLGKFTIQQARSRPRWVEVLSFRGLCGTLGAFFDKKTSKEDAAKQAALGVPLPLDSKGGEK